MSYETVLYELDGSVLTITLNRPDKLNAATDTLLHELADAFKQAGKDTNVRAVILTGAGRGFCAGQDLASANDRRNSDGSINFGEHLRHSWNVVITRIAQLGKPVICYVNGVAAGAGMGLVMACDLRYANDTASFIQAFINIGLVPDSGSTWTLQRLVGPARAAEMMFTGRKVSAQEAWEWGLLNGVVVNHEEQYANVRTIAHQLAAMPTRGIALTKRALAYAADSTLEQALENEADMQDLAGRTSDHTEGVTAFLEKRKATFQGK